MTFNCQKAVQHLDTVYQEIRKKLTAVFDEIAANESEIERVNADKTLSEFGKRARNDERKLKIRALQEQADLISREAAQRFADAQEYAKTMCGGRFTVRPQDVDEKAFALIKADVLTADELMRLADQADTLAMQRLYGKALVDRAATGKHSNEVSTTLRAHGAMMLRQETPLDDLLNAFQVVLDAGTRPTERSNATHAALHDKALHDALAAAAELDAAYTESGESV